METLKLCSKNVAPKTNYAVGVLADGALHLTPLHAALRMLPSFEHIDAKVRARVRARAFSYPSGSLVVGGFLLCVHDVLFVCVFCPSAPPSSPRFSFVCPWCLFSGLDLVLRFVICCCSPRRRCWCFSQ